MTPRALARARRLAALRRDLLVSVRRAQRADSSPVRTASRRGAPGS